MLRPVGTVAGRVPEGPENAVLEKVRLRMVTGCELVTVRVRGWDETLPLDPLKLSAVVESLMLLVCACECDQTGLAIRIAAKGKRTFFFKIIAPEWGKRWGTRKWKGPEAGG
jgi:hypothetical protein